jgi:DNA ligase-1
MKDNLQLLKQMVDELNSTNSINEKKDILAKYKNDEYLKKVLYYTYNPFYQYYVTPANLEKRYSDDLGATSKLYTNLIELLDDLRNRVITGHTAIQSVNDFVYANETYKDLIYKVIGKDLEIRMGDSLINKVIPDLIPTFDCALATDFDKVEANLTKDVWLASRKLDGVRCLAVINEAGRATLWSRQGNQFETLQKVISEIEKLGMKDMVLDGEICLTDANGNEDFQGIMKQIRRKDHTIDNPKYLIFDIIEGSAFRSKLGTKLYTSRYTELNAYLYNAKENGFKHLEVVTQSTIADEAHYIEMMENADANGWEGLILRKADVVYEGKRSKNMLKCKSFKDAEYKVIDLEFGPFRMIENGLEVTKEVLSNVVIEHKGNRVSVGSGFSIGEREYFKANPNEILNKIITVKYFQETQNQSGAWSLRFPTVKVIHGSKRLV